MKMFVQRTILLLLILGPFLAPAQVPAMSSFPQAAPTIFLDFDGHVVRGTAWNGVGDLVCEPTTLNTAQIVSIFNRVAEDYRPFTVNVTTDSAAYAAAPANKRMRVVFTVSSSWYGAAGGVAFINSFTWGDNTPCFVFTALLNNNTKFIAEAASHEAGHTLGLRHQSSYDAVCNKTAEYNAGTGSGEIAWAPIMGVGYYRNMTLWNYGANPYGCNAFQDDLAVITGNGNGIGYRSDDYTHMLPDAAMTTFSGNTFTVQGIIERPGDADAVAFQMPAAGRFTLDASPYNIAAGSTGANLDLEVELLNSAGTVMGTYNPASTLNTTVDTNLSAGRYYLRTKGRGNAFAPNYASLGAYTLNASITPGNPLPLHKLHLKGTAEKGRHNLQWEIVADEKVVGQTLESSADRNTFAPVTAMGSTARNVQHMPSTGDVVYYRLNVRFDNGREYLSNIVALRNTDRDTKPMLLGNAVTGTLTASCPETFIFEIVDMAGRRVQSGKMAQGINFINLSTTGSGMFLIRFSNGSMQHTEKFSRL